MVSYDRTLLSKALPNIEASKILLRPAEFLTETDINFKLNSSVSSLDTDSKSVTLSSGE